MKYFNIKKNNKDITNNLLKDITTIAFKINNSHNLINKYNKECKKYFNINQIKILIILFYFN